MRLTSRCLALIATGMLAAALSVVTTGCETASKPAPQFADVHPETWEPQPATGSVRPGDSIAPPATAQPVPAAVPAQGAPAGFTPLGSPTDRLRVDDVVTVTVTGITAETIPPHEERIKEDGSITLYLVGRVQAAGKSTGELQNELQKLYENYFRNPVVTVRSAERVYYVGGEVKRPGVQLYIGETTVTKAIQSAGDFTDFAQRRSIRVIRGDGTTLTVNWNRILKDPRLDPPVFPNDRIHVPRRLLW